MTALKRLRQSEADRRASQRFPIEEEVCYKVRVNKNQLLIGKGKTVNISSRGILFTTEHGLEPGLRVEISVNWPAQLNGDCPLKLVASGKIVRVEADRAAVQIDRYEFRTRGSEDLLAKMRHEA